MRNFERTLVALILTIFIFALVALFIPGTREILAALWLLFWIPFKAFFLEDIVWKSLILIAILALGVILSLSQREQRKLWIILTTLLEIISTILLFK